ncbi:MAG: DUF2975 domain-containing protein [Erythrobacter sp.]
MTSPRNDLLLAAGKMLTLLIQGIMGIAAIAIMLVIGAVTLFSGTIDQEIRAEFGADMVALPVMSVVWLLLAVLALTGLVYMFFGKLRGIINTVAIGDPFVPENADRLSAMAWLQIGIYIMGIVANLAAGLAARWAGQFTDVEIRGSVELDIPSVLLVIVLFILARVFRHGAMMREDLEGTV